MNIHRLSDVEEVTRKLETQIDALIEKIQGNDSWNVRDTELVKTLDKAKNLLTIARCEADIQQRKQHPVKPLPENPDETAPDGTHYDSAR